jgi:starch phosphorylase
LKIAENVGLDHLHLRQPHRAGGRLARQWLQPAPLLRPQLRSETAIDRIAEGAFNPEEPNRFHDITRTLLESDYYLLLADYADYIATQQKVDELYRRPTEWTRQAILNVAGMGAFSSDRTIREYADEIGREAIF